MTKTLKAALKKSSKKDSSFWDRMEKIVKESTGFGHISEEQRNHVLDFFTPEWEDRDGRFFPRLDDFTQETCSLEDLPSALADLRLDDASGVPHGVGVVGVNKLAKWIDASFSYAMSLSMTLAYLGIAKRATPYRTSAGTPAYNVAIDYSLLRLALKAIEAYGPNTIGFFTKFFKPELDTGNVDFACDTLIRSSVYAPAVGAETVLTSNPNVAFSIADIESKFSGNRERAAITRQLLNLAFAHSQSPPSTGVIQRVEPFFRVHPHGLKTPRVLFAFLPFVKIQGPPKTVEIGTLSKQEAKDLLSSLTPATAPITVTAPVVNDELKLFIQKAVQEAVEKALVDPDRQQMEGIRAMLRERKLPTNDPVATIKAKLSRKKPPSSKA